MEIKVDNVPLKATCQHSTVTVIVSVCYNNA